MNRIVLSALAGAVLCTALVRADDKDAEKPKDRSAQLSDLQKEVQKLMPEVIKAYQSAKSNDDRDKALAKFEPIHEKGYKLIAENPKDDVSYNTLMLLLRTAPQPPQKVIDLLTDNFINDVKLAGFVMQSAGNPGMEKLLSAAEKSTNKSVAGAAALSVAN